MQQHFESQLDNGLDVTDGNATTLLQAYLVWPISVRSSWKLLSRFHSLTVLSLLVVASCWQSGLMRHLRM